MNINEIITTDNYLSFCNDNDICYIKTDFFVHGKINWRGEIHPKTIKDVCVVGHSDYSINGEIAKKFKKIFCVNRNTNVENVFGIPLGITNDCADSEQHRIYGDRNIMINVHNENITKTNLAYLNFNISTYPYERNYIYQKFKNENWVTTGNNDTTLDSRIKFLRDIKSSKFVFCPRGNGIDTHRLWETLYMGSIPIVIYENAHHLFTDLPILFINNWEIITEKYLNEKYIEFTNKNWNLEKLNQSYWNNFILEKLN